MARTSRGQLRVFISHTSDMASFPEGRSFVRAVTDGVRRSGCVAVTMGDFAAASSDPESYCKDQVRGCDVYIGVIGFRYGSLVRTSRGGPAQPSPPTSRGRAHPFRSPSGLVPRQVGAGRRSRSLSYTELEFQTASDAGLPRLLFLLRDDTPVPRSLIDRELDRVDAFRERLRSADVTVATFTSADNLEASVLHALAQLGPRAARTATAPSPSPSEGPPAGAPAAPATAAPVTTDRLTADQRSTGDQRSAGDQTSAGPGPAPAPVTQGAQTDTPGDRPSRRPAGGRRRGRVLIGVALAAAAIAGAAAGFLARPSHPALACESVPPATPLPPAATWVGPHEGQCVGFSDGLYIFDPSQSALTGTLGLIAAQNRAAGPRPYDVVVAAPLTVPGAPGGGDVSDSATTALGQGGLNELLGAQRAQAAINAPDSGYGIRVRLLVANVGGQSSGAPLVARHIAAAMKADPRLVGVLGLFQSTAGGKEAVAALNSEQIPIVSSTASDDALTTPVGPPGQPSRRYPWYFRVGPTNRREAQAMVAAIPRILAGTAGPSVTGDPAGPAGGAAAPTSDANPTRGAAGPVRPLIVTSAADESHPPANPDDYSDNLAVDVTAALRDQLGVTHVPRLAFPTAAARASPSDPATSTVFGRLTAALNARCADVSAQPNLLVYTGRTTSVNILLDALEESSCPRGLPILAGDDAMELETEPGEIIQESRTAHPFYFADFGLSQPGDNPAQYVRDPAGKALVAQEARQLAGSQGQADGPAALSGHTVAAFVATSVLAQAIHVASISPPSPGGPRATVAVNLARRCGNSAALTVNGYVNIDRYGDSTTAPVVIRRRDPAGTSFPALPGGDAAASFQQPSAGADCAFAHAR